MNSDRLTSLNQSFDSTWRFVRCAEGALPLLRSMSTQIKEYDHAQGGVEALFEAEGLSRLADFPADFKVEASRRDADLQALAATAKYRAVRVATMYGGLLPLALFNSVEITRMVGDVSRPDELAPLSWKDEEVVTAFSVQLHYRRGGLETVSDFIFNPDDPGSRARAESSAEDLAISLGEMLLLADPGLEVGFVIGKHLANDPRVTSATGPRSISSHASVSPGG